MVIYRFPLLAPCKSVEAEQFYLRFPDPAAITEIPDKLRYYRYKHGLLQREVAERIGIDRAAYVHYEESGRDYYPIAHMEKLAALYGLPVMELLDAYNRFLYRGQGRQIREIRMARQLSQREYADMIGVHICNLRRWESDQVRISKSAWKRLEKLE